jgi:hypothetical protein
MGRWGLLGIILTCTGIGALLALLATDALSPESWTALATVLLTFVTAGLVLFNFRQERTTRVQLRAYVFVRAARINGVRPGQAPTATITLQNFGQTPAFRVRQWANMGFDQWPPTMEPPMEDRPGDILPETTLGPSGELLANPHSRKSTKRSGDCGPQCRGSRLVRDWPRALRGCLRR